MVLGIVGALFVTQMQNRGQVRFSRLTPLPAKHLDVIQYQKAAARTALNMTTTTKDISGYKRLKIRRYIRLEHLTGLFNTHYPCRMAERTALYRVEDGLWVTHTSERLIVKLDLEDGKILDTIKCQRITLNHTVYPSMVMISSIVMLPLDGLPR